MSSPKPRSLIYADRLLAIEERVVDALSEIIEALIVRAKAGDLKAAVYLGDRILRRTAEAKIAPADDQEQPYDAAAFDLDQEERDEHHDFRRMFALSEARKGAWYTWGSSTGTADPTSIDPSGGSVGSHRNTWRAAPMPSLSLPWRPTDGPTGKRTRPSGRNSTTWSEPSTSWPGNRHPAHSHHVDKWLLSRSCPHPVARRDLVGLIKTR